MSTTVRAPDCVHLSDLTAGRDATITWNRVGGSGGCEVELYYDYYLGPTRYDIFIKRHTWRKFEVKDLSWKDIQSAPFKSNIELGHPRSSIEQYAPTWQSFHSFAFTWEDIHYIPYDPENIGRTRRNIDAADNTWLELGAADLNWRQLTMLSTLPLAFKGLGEDEGPLPLTCLANIECTWTSLEEADLTWVDIHAHGHRSFTIEMPRGKKMAIFRLRAYRNGEYSDWITVGPELIHAFLHEGLLEWEAIQGEHYYIQLDVWDARDFDDETITLEYPAELLSLELCALEGPEDNEAFGLVPVTDEEGRFQFQLDKEIEENKWSGFVLTALLHALASGEAAVKLS